MIKCLRLAVCCAVLAVVIGFAACRPAEGDHGGSSNDARAMCALPTYKGLCRALIPRWSFDPKTGECQEFKFGGCQGNANNFPTYSACMKVCGS